MEGKANAIRNPYLRESNKALSQRCELATKHSAEEAKSMCLKELSSASALVVSAVDKAGMDGIDRAKIDAIILKESGNSLFMQQQRRRDDNVNAKIALLRTKLQSQEVVAGPNWRTSLEKHIDAEIPSWLARRPARSAKVVVDMDMFYMACELLSRPDITDDVPACVGDSSMILTSNYAARRYGVRSAMPGYIGEVLVRELSKGDKKLIFCKSNFHLYKEKARVVREVLSQYDPNLSAYSLDEAYMDLGPYLACSFVHPDWNHEMVSESLTHKEHVESTDGEAASNFPTTVTPDNSMDVLLSIPPMTCLARAGEVITEMRDKVRLATGGLTCSAGLAPNFRLAKIASDRNKPNGQLIVRSDHASITKFLYPLPIRKVSGIGRVTAKILKAFGVESVQQLYEERALASFLFEPSSKSSGFLMRASVGCSSSDEKESEADDSSSQQKGISRERTMQSGKTWPEVNSKLEDIGRLLSDDMERKGIWAQTITMKVKLHTFDVFSKAKTLPNGVFVQASVDLVRIAAGLLREIRQQVCGNAKGKKWDQRLFSVRLLGIRCSSFRGTTGKRGAMLLSGQSKMDEFLARTPSPVPPTSHDDTAADGKQKVTGDVNPYSAKRCLGIDQHAPQRRKQELSGDITGQSTSPGATMPPRISLLSECPICRKVLQGDDAATLNQRVNRHMDTCLSGAEVRRAVREESDRTTSPKRPRLTDFFGATKKRATR